MARRAASLAAAAALAAGCGYAFTAGGGRLPKGAEKVFVRPLENHTTDAEAGALVASALRTELARRDAAGGAQAHARLEGEVEDVSFGPSGFSGAANHVAITVAARLFVDGNVVAQTRSRRDEEYLSGADPLETEGRRRVALRRAAEAAAREVVERFEAQ
jgi:hypothetical protein